MMGTPVVTVEQIYEVLKTVYDPEIPLSIVELGLVYDIKVDRGNVYVKMSLTTPGCGMGPHIAGNAEKAIKALPGVKQVMVEIVWDPRWSPEMMSPEAKQKLGFS